MELLALHLVTFLSILVPVYFFLRIYTRSKGEFTNAFLGLLLGFIPLALYSLIEVLDELGAITLPPEESFAHQLFMHGAQIIAFVALALFLVWFDKKFVAPFYGEEEGAGKKKK